MGRSRLKYKPKPTIVTDDSEAKRVSEGRQRGVSRVSC
ncbi:hypothetical protein E2C01_076857 [Portunus trituberculatus]|uniref:Uncharacterized protein n=1 Tax=Portunus trituberculatus TaxID=210409 RepID=A0A5B7IJP0_PORTR|nr:hypothetical protein [Portunus trituberculatus]